MSHFSEVNRDLFIFIEASPTAYQATHEVERELRRAEYELLSEEEEWNLQEGGRYMVKRNDSSIIAFCMPDCGIDHMKGFHAICTHSDSPSFKIKENAQITVENYTKLNVEKYGGMILSTWLDRPLSIAGRVVCEMDGEVITKSFDAYKELAVIPNVAIHLNRDMNKGVEYNPQVDMLPLFGTKDDRSFTEFLEDEINCVDLGEEIKRNYYKKVLSYDLFLYVKQKGKEIGCEKEYILAPRLDDLQCSFAAMTAMKKSRSRDYMNVFAMFDNEEVGSGTAQGADSTFLSDIFERIADSFGKNGSWLKKMYAGSFFISADNAHAVHPNHPEKSDPTNKPVLNGGLVIKYHGGQKYTTDAKTAAAMKMICERANVPVQSYFNRSDIIGGSTLGNISTAHVSVPTVDVGLPQLAMHSAVETAGAMDTAYGIRAFTAFYEEFR